MESRFFLKATDKEVKALMDGTIATVKLITFMGDKEEYPQMDYNSNVVHKWDILLRHREDIGEIEGTLTYKHLMDRLFSHQSNQSTTQTVANQDNPDLRKAVLSARRAASKAFSKVDELMDHVPEEEWSQYHNLKDMLYKVYAALDNKYNQLKK